MSYNTHILTKPICEMSFDDSVDVDIYVTDIGHAVLTCSVKILSHFTKPINILAL